MASGQPGGMASEAISGSFAAEISHYLMVVIGEPLGEEFVDLTLADVEKALQCWDVDDAAIGYDAALQAAAAADVNKVGLVHRSLASCGSNVGVVVLINPTSTEVTAELRNLLIHSASKKHLIFGGHWLEGCGDWVLHNDTFTLHDIANVFNEPDVDAAVLASSQEERQTLVVSGCHWSTASVTKQTFTKSLNLTINPQEVKNEVAGISLIMQTIRNNIQIPSPFELLEPPTMGVGVKCKITKPTVLIFPAGKGDCAFFAVTDFSIFLGGGYCTKSCFWKFAKHLHRIDAIMAPHMQPDSLMGFNSLLKRKIAEQQLPEPEKGSEEYEDWLIKCNSPEVGVVYLNAPENKKSPMGLQLKTVSQGNLTQKLLQELEIKPFSCMSNVGKVIEPVTLYQKVGIGRLDMFILTPVHDSKELKDFMQQWSGNKPFAKVKTGMKVNGKETECPSSSVVSICALIVWQPASPHEDIVKVLFPGNAPQSKVLEGLDRLKHLDYLKYPDVTAAMLSKGGAQLKKKPRAASAKTPVKANGPTSSVAVNADNQAPCNDGVHCNTPPPCPDGIHCGTPPPDTTGECPDGIHCNTPPPCPDGIHCGTPPPDTTGECPDGIHCNTPPPCPDGIHCGTPPPDTTGECPDGIHCNTPPPCPDGIHCGTPPPDTTDECPDGLNWNTPPPDKPSYKYSEGKKCSTPPAEDGFKADECGNFAPIEPYKCPDGIHCNTPPPEGEVVYADGTYCNTPPPEEDVVMDTQQSPVDNEPQATVQGDMCGNMMDSNLPESQQDMGAFTYSAAPDAFNNKPLDASDRLDSGEITPSDQVEYGGDSPKVGSFVFEADEGSKEPAAVPSGFGDYAEEDHAAAPPSEYLIGEYEKKRELSDDSESPTNGNQGVLSGAFDDESPSPNGRPHPWEPQIEFSSPDQEPEDNYLVEACPKADAHEEQSAPVSYADIPPPVVSYDDQNVEQQIEAQPSPQEYSQDGQYEQQEDVLEEDEEEDSSEASQASEIEVKPEQQIAEEENLMAYEEPIPAAHPEPVESEDFSNVGGEEVQDEERDDAVMDINNQISPEQVEMTPEDQLMDQGFESDGVQSSLPSDIRETAEQEVVNDEVEQLLELQPSEGQEAVAVDDEEGEMEMGHAGSVESPAPEEDQDQVVPEVEYEEQIAPTDEPVTEAWNQEGLQEINQNFMTSEEVPASVEDENDQLEEISPQPEADIDDNRNIQADEMAPLSHAEADADYVQQPSEDLVQYDIEPLEKEPPSPEYQAEDLMQGDQETEPASQEYQTEDSMQDDQVTVPAIQEYQIEDSTQDDQETEPAIQEYQTEDSMQDVQEPEPATQEYQAEDMMQGDTEDSSDQPEVMQAELEQLQAEQAPEEIEDVQQTEELSDQPEVIQSEFEQSQPEQAPEKVEEYSVESPGIPSTLISEPESGPDLLSEPLQPEPALQPEIIAAPEYQAEDMMQGDTEDSSDQPEVMQAELEQLQAEQAPEEIEDVQQAEELSDQPEVIQSEFEQSQPEQAPEEVEEYSVESPGIPSTLISEPESGPDLLSEPLQPEPALQPEIIAAPEYQAEDMMQGDTEDSSDQPEVQPEIIAVPVPEYEAEASYEQEVIQEEESVPEQQSSEPLVDSLSEPQSDKEQDSLSDPQFDQAFDPVAAPEPQAEIDSSEASPPAPILDLSPQPSPELQPEPVKEPSPQPSPEPQPEPQPLVAIEVTDVAESDVSAPQQPVEPEPEPEIKIVPEVAAKSATSVSTKTTTKTSKTTTTTKKPADKATKKDIKTSKSITKDTKSTTKTRTSTLAEKRSTTRTSPAGTKKSEPLGAAKKRTTVTEQKTTAEKKSPPEKKPLERKSLAERKTLATEKKTSRLSAAKPTTATSRPQTNRDKSPGKLWERQTAASASRSSSSNNSRTKTNGSGDTKPAPTRKAAPSKVTAKTPTKTGTQRPTGSKAPASGRKPADSTKRESDRLSKSAPSKTADARKSDSSKRPISAKASPSASKTQAIPVSGPPIYVDLTYIPHHASEDSVNMEFFRRIRAKNYVISANDKGRNQPSLTVMDALLEGRSKWDDPEAEVTVIPTYDIGTLQEWEQKNLQQLSDSKITISQPASRSIVQMKDENFFMYKVEF